MNTLVRRLYRRHEIAVIAVLFAIGFYCLAGIVLAQSEVPPNVAKQLLVDMGIVSGAIGALGGYLRVTPLPNEWIPILMFPAGVAIYLALSGAWTDPVQWALALVASQAGNGFVQTGAGVNRLRKGTEVIEVPRDDLRPPPN